MRVKIFFKEGGLPSKCIGERSGIIMGGGGGGGGGEISSWCRQ